MTAERLTLRICERIAHIQLSRPEAHNAMDPAFVNEFSSAIDVVEAEQSVRTVLISALGPSFCVGGDLAYFSSRPTHLTDDLKWMVDHWHKLLPRLAALPFPVIAAIQGGTAGGGLGPVWCADYVIAAESTVLAGGFADIGLSGDGGASWHLPRYVGLRRAQAFILDNERVDASKALEWGLVNRVVPDNELGEIAWETARRFSQRSATAFAHAKRLLLESSTNDYVEHLQAEALAIHDCAERQDVRTGIQAFAAGTKPEFTDPVPQLYVSEIS